MIGSADPSEWNERRLEHSEGLGEGALERSGGADVEGGMAGARTEPLKDEFRSTRRGSNLSLHSWFGGEAS
ncbi:hypothetical protein AKJ35_01060 [candidate division MSBL1 archaeon SCGC-AAA833F18]|uniref:Uncharacterized protein n=1 Tax=candidate division MSBL1 archaeon SCGC-AAA833F18 TaxID=1698257 RepID=A0A133VS65_9EURY|nr:hypothetical protein AKJ35_01060 [candidate division MSBL1 archaeon SCGC-AAA833F18]